MNKKTTKYEVKLTAQEEAYLLHLISQGMLRQVSDNRTKIQIYWHDYF